MIVFLLVVWAGSGSTQTTFSVPDIESKAECQRLATVMQKKYSWGFSTPEVDCIPYRKAK